MDLGIAGEIAFVMGGSRGMGRIAAEMARKTLAQGAATSVVAATSPELADHGEAYLEGCRRSDAVAPHAQDPADAARLRTLSEELVGGNGVENVRAGTFTDARPDTILRSGTDTG